MRHIRQTNSYNCGPTALAIALDTTIEQATALTRDPSIDYGAEFAKHNDGFTRAGIGHDEMCLAIFKTSTLHCHVWPRDTPGIAAYHIPDRDNALSNTKMSLDEVALWLRETGYRAIFGVKSKKIEGAGHWIAGDADFFYDPGDTQKRLWADSQDDPWQVNGGIILICKS